MRKQYGSEDVEYNFSEDVSNDLIEVNFDNTALFDDVEQTISLDKDGSFTDLEVVNQLSPELLEGVDTDKLTDDVKRDLSEHIHLNQMQNSINLEVKDIEYDTGVEDFPQAIINVDFEGETYTNYASLDKEYQKGSEVYITDDSFFNEKLIDDVVNKYGEASEPALKSLHNKIDDNIAGDSSFIKEEQDKNIQKDNSKKRSRSLGMSM